MYLPDLTLEEACADIAPAWRWQEWVLDQEHPFVVGQRLATERRVQIAEVLFGNKDLCDLVCAEEGFADILGNQQNLSIEYGAAVNQMDNWFVKEGPNAFIRGSLKLGALGMREFEILNHSFSGAVRELAMNAVEHGSNWCEEGPVVIRAAANDKSEFVVTVDQLGDFDVSLLPVAVSIVHMGRSLIKHKGGVKRGCGFEKMMRCQSANFNLVLKEEGGVRAIAFCRP